MNSDLIDSLRKVIENEVFITPDKQRIVSPSGRESNWLFDFRKVLMRPEMLVDLGAIFLERFKDKYPFQIGCLEVAGIPLATGLALALYNNDYRVNAFFIRKSRKKHGLLNMVEGEIDDTKIILVDDIINSGSSFIRQVEVLEGLGKKIDTVFSILRYREESFYTYFHEKGIKVVSLFSLDDFKESLPVQNLIVRDSVSTPMPFSIDWYFKSNDPNYYYVVPKSAPAIDATKLYYGSDSGNFWALNQSDGTVAWKYKVGLHVRGKSIFSSPLVHKDVVYFGAYDGNFYALDTETGKTKWVFMEADWIGSSPCVSPKNNLVYVGLEFGLFRKHGGIAALDAATGKKAWEHVMPAYVHSSPAYSDKQDIVVCGSNNNVVYAFVGKSGAPMWEYVTEAEVKESFAFDDAQKVVVFGSHDTYVYILDSATGTLRHKVKTDQAIYSTPVIHKGKAYASSLDKKIYCIDIKTGVVDWHFTTNGRVFASPVVIEGAVYIGSNDGRLYELDAQTGELTAKFQAVERITNAVAYNKKTKRLFLPTFANEIICLTKDGVK